MSSDGRLNILYIMTDQQRFDTIGLYGLTNCKTLNLDRLANSGVRFDRAYTCCSLCSPARASMLCGKYPHTHHMWNNQDMMQWAIRNLPDDIELISQPLGRAGYQCGYVGKWHCGQEKVPSHYGFEGMDVPNYGNPYKTHEYQEYLKRHGLKQVEVKSLITDFTPRRGTMGGEMIGDIRASATYFLSEYAIEMMKRFQDERERTGKPWFIFLSYWLPHHPYTPPREYYEMYDVKETKLWENFHDDLKGKPPNQRRYRECYHRAIEHSDETWRELITRYFAQTTFLDAQIGRVLDALDELGLSDSTAVLFSTDHGDMCGSHGKFHDKDAFMYEELYHIPLFIRIPGVTKPNTVRNEFVLNMDLAATALDIAGVGVPDDYEARSLLPLARGDAVDWRDDVMCEYFGHRFLFSQRMIRWGRYKYILNLPSFDELYDLEEDPHELNNLIHEPAMKDVIAEGQERLLNWIKDTNDAILHAAQMAMSR